MSKRGLTNRGFLFSLLAILLVFSIFSSINVSAAKLGETCGDRSEGICKTACLASEDRVLADSAEQSCDTGVCCAAKSCTTSGDCPIGFICSANKCALPSSSASILITEGCTNQTIGIFSKAYCVWFGGLSSANFDLAGEVIKWIFLLLIIILVYSAMSYVKFPEGAGLRLLLSVVVGVLATFLITTQELVTILSSYTALGVTLTVFFPIVVLLFFTILVASKASPIGIFVQRIMWMIYSVYLFFKTWTLYIISSTACKIDVASESTFKASMDACHEAGVTVVGWLTNYPTINSLMAVKGKFDTPMLILLLVVAIAVFIVMVVSNKPIRVWLANERFLADIESQKDIIGRSQALRREEAKATRGEAGQA